MIKYSKIRYWLLSVFAFLIIWGSVNYLRGGDPSVPTVLFCAVLVVLLILTLLGKIDYDVR